MVIKTMIKNKLSFLILAIILPFLMVKPAFAGFGVSPAEIYNDSLKPGSKFEKDIVLSRSDTDENLKVVIETDLGDAGSWIKFDPGTEFIFAKGETRKTVKATVSVPNNAELKNYKGFLRIKASSMDSTSSGVSIIKGARMEVNLVTTSLSVDILNIKGLNIPDVDFQKPIKLLVNVQNNGNTDISPSKVILEVQDLNKNTIETQNVTKIEKVSSNTTKEITAEFKNDLNSGEYFGNVQVFLGDKLLRSDRLVFKIGPAPAGYKPTVANTKNVSIFKKIISAVQQNKVETTAVVLIPLLAITTADILIKRSTFKLLFFKLKKTKIIKSQKAKIIYLIINVGYFLIALTGLHFYHQQRLNNLAKPNDQGHVQGASIEVKPTAVPKANPQSNLMVKQEKTGYPIYRIPSLNSEIVYTASENEKLSVVEEKDGWYRVSTGKGTGGWLPKSSVKKTE